MYNILSFYGTVEAIQVPTGRETYQTKRLAFVEFRNSKDAELCVEKLNKGVIDGSYISVELASSVN